MSHIDQSTARAIVQGLPSQKCDGNHGGPRCADPECWNGGEPQAVKAEAPIYVVVCANDKPHPKFGRDPYGPLVWESYTRNATLQGARELAARVEHNGACRIARLVFEDVDGRPL